MEAIGQPLVSVILPVYNVERYIKECLESVLRQTYETLEVIIVDDGSPDNCGRIADEIAAQDARVKVIHQENRGVAAARNAGMDAAKGEFLTFVDSDDWISDDYVSHLMSLQRQYDSDMCFTTAYYTQKSDIQAKDVVVKKISNKDAAVILLSPGIVIGTYNKLYRRSWLEKNGLRQNEQLFSGEGLNFIVTAAEYANHVTVSNRRIYYYRRNVSQSATTKFNIRMFTNNELSLDLLEENKVIEYDRFDEMLNHFRVQLMISGILAIHNNSSPKEYAEEYKRWQQGIRKMGGKLILSKNITLKYKIRIVCAMLFPGAWAMLAKLKRKRIYKRSV